MVSFCVEFLAVELVMLFFVEIEIKKEKFHKTTKYHRRVAKNTLLCRVEIYVHVRKFVFHRLLTAIQTVTNSQISKQLNIGYMCSPHYSSRFSTFNEVMHILFRLAIQYVPTCHEDDSLKRA